MEDNRQESECTLQKLLDQPYVPPCMFYEKKTVMPKETAFIQKAHKLSMSNKQSSFVQQKLIKQALDVQNDRFKVGLQKKDDFIQRQQKVML